MTHPPCEPQARATPHHHAGAPELADRMGIGVSLTCAVHCAATGALSLAPSLVSVGHGEGSSLGTALELMETPLLALALLIGLYSLVPAYRHEHRNPQPLALFLLGLGQLVASRFVEGPLEIAVTVVGVGFVAVSHLLNLRACTRAHRSLSSGALST
ncbi:MAG: MerC domain-containing protein [Sandaracinaceae bacterium]|nr:MerC domain-containing protein [Sandaracinaceae bacterium]